MSCRVMSRRVMSGQVNARFMFQAHITHYKGYRFRSGIEAKWACFFDKVGFDWLYEPMPLLHYLPDFILNGIVLAEVKYAITEKELEEHVDKIKASGWIGPYVLLGASWNIQLGDRLTLPDNAATLWAEACNTVQWKLGTEPKEYAAPDLRVDLSQFARKESVVRERRELTLEVDLSVFKREEPKFKYQTQTRIRLPE